VNQREKADFAIDANPATKWCDISNQAPKFIEIDLGKDEEIKGWFVAHAGIESLSYITKEYSLEVKKELNNAWQMVDKITNNTEQETDRLLQAPVHARYVRLVITKPDQNEGNDARIYEFEIY
jgi:alpha-mannosidase